MNFKVNEYLILRLEDKKSNIYIKGKLFQQCKFLLINIPIEEMSLFNEIASIDDAAELLDPSLEEIEGYHYNISPEVEFWAHCSNLQVWYENGYNTKLLHSNLAFSLLQKLYQSGDPLAKKRYKEEIAERFIYGNSQIQDFLYSEGYLEALTREEKFSLIKDSDIIIKLEMLFETPMRINTRSNPHSYGFVVEKGVIKWLSLDNRGLNRVPEIVRELKLLEGLTLSRNSLETLPDWIDDFDQLEVLDVSNNQLKEIPESIGNLGKLKQLKLQNNKLKGFPTSIGDLAQLEVFFAHENIIEVLPESMGKLMTLKRFSLRDNLIKFIPESIVYMKNLKFLDLAKNPLQKLPRSILYLKNLEFLTLSNEHKTFSEIFTLKMRKIVSFI